MHGDSSTVMLCSVIFKIICYLLAVTTFYSEFTSVIKTTNTKKRNSTNMQCFMGLNDELDGVGDVNSANTVLCV